MSRKRKPQFDQSPRRYTDPPPQLHLDPIGVTARIKDALNRLAPIFIINCPEATAPMIAAVMRVTKLYAEANNDDVANVLLKIGLRPDLRQGKIYFDLSAYVNQKPKVETILRRGGE